jgi:hypothetical protein
MKSFISLISFLIIFSISISADAQKLMTDTLTVRGNCGQCKDRIEEASYTKGVKHAEWNKKSQVLTVVYRKDKTNLDNIAATIAAKGHDNRLHTAPDSEYKLLPGCCAYRTGKCDHE